MLEKKQNGFTLIEIIVVLIILGILTSLGLPAIFSQIERNRAQEALNNINFIKSAVESCGIENSNNFTKCTTFTTQINLDDPSYNAGTNPGANFQYTISNGGAGISYVITATRAAGVRGGNSADYLTVTRLTNGSVSCVGYNRYGGFC